MQTFFELVIDLLNFPGMLRNLNKQRQLIASLTWRDFQARYRGSFGGIFWSFFQPLIMMVIYTVVFSSFLKIKFGISDSPFAFSVYLLCGLLPWTAFSETISVSNSVIRANRNLVKRVVFPLEILPLNVVLATTMQFLIGFLLLLPMAWLLNGRPSASLVLLPLIMLLQVILFAGLAWIWSSLSVYIPDFSQITALLLTIGMFLTPIFYPIDIVPEWAIPIMNANPFANLVTIYRLIIMDNLLPTIQQISYLFFTAITAIMVGYFWFIRTKKGFADVL